MKMKEKEKLNKYRRAEKSRERQGDDDANCYCHPWNCPQRPRIVIRVTENQRKNRYLSGHCTIKISFNT